MAQLFRFIADYCYALVQASRKEVNNWTYEVLQRNIQLAVYVECEMAVLEDNEIEVAREEASKYNRRVTDFTTGMLRDAHHTLYKALIGSPYLTNDMFWRIVQTYRFLNRPDETCEETLIQVFKRISHFIE
jgi:tRNA G37 N-methylase Trm5